MKNSWFRKKTKVAFGVSLQSCTSNEPNPVTRSLPSVVYLERRLSFGVSHICHSVSLFSRLPRTNVCHFEPQGEILKELKLMVMKKISPA